MQTKEDLAFWALLWKLLTWWILTGAVQEEMEVGPAGAAL